MRLSGPSTLSPKLDHIENTTAAATHCEIQDTRHIPQTRFREKHSTHKFDLAIATVNVRQVYSHLPPPSHLHVGVGDGLDFRALRVLAQLEGLSDPQSLNPDLLAFHPGELGNLDLKGGKI